MIRSCSYCQRFLGELAPYDRPEFTHSVCAACDARLERDEPVTAETEDVRGLVRALLQSARDSDERVFAQILPRARALGLDGESLLLAVLQPALYQAGLDWEDGSMSVAAEHRLSAWCERVFGMLEPPPPAPRPLDLLVLQAPGNLHTIGPRFAAQVLALRGMSVELALPEPRFEDLVSLVARRQPRVIGFSCSLPGQVPAVVALIARLRARLEPGQRCRYLLSGVAFRLGGGAVAPDVGPGIEVAVDLAVLRAAAG